MKGGKHSTGAQRAVYIGGMKWRLAEPSRWLLALLLVVAIVPAAALAYLQYKSLSQVEEQTQQAFLSNLQQALIGVRVESVNDFALWLQTGTFGIENHDWLIRRDVARIQDLAEVTQKICPRLSLFFAYRYPEGERGKGKKPEVWVYRPGPDRWHMQWNESDGAAAQIPAMVEGLHEKPQTYYYTAYTDLDGEKEQVFLHLVNRLEKGERREFIGYYGFAVSARVLAEEYYPELLKKHLARLASTGNLALDKPVSARILDGTGTQVGAFGKGEPGPLTAHEHLDPQEGLLPGWSVQAGFSDRGLSTFARDQFMRGVWVTVVITAVMLVAIVFIGMTAAREMRLSRAKSEFVASVSHELKTPLSLIRGFAETLHMNRLRSAEDREEYFRIIEAEILRLSMMIDKILEFSKIEVGLKSYQPELSDVAAITEETLGHFSYELERAGFKVESDFPDHPIYAEVDPQAFSQALLNLLSNALKYSGERRYVGVRAAAANGHVEISVADRGIGIARHELERIFEKFYRVGAGRNAKTTGAGLGLALVKHFAEGHGGAVQVASSPGRGSTFTIVLPAPKGVPAAEAASEKPAAVAAAREVPSS